MEISKLVTIIVPVYNVKEYIGKCADSLFSQTYADIEYIFINDCTLDASMDILHSVLEKHPQRYAQVKIINNEMNRGLAYCRNKGLQYAHGDYILHVDSDDFITINAVAELVLMAEKENADIVVSDFLLVKSKRVTEDTHIYPMDKTLYIKKLLERELPVCICGKMYKRELYTKNHIAVPDGIDFGEDMVTLPRLAYYAKKIVKSSPFYYYNQLNINSYTKHIGENAIISVIHTEQVLRDFFYGKIEYIELNELLSVYMQKMRTELLFNTTAQLRKKYVSLFVQSIPVNLRLIPFLRQRLFIALFDRHFYHLSELYLKSYYFLQKCKRRLLK